jgi:hypothetical protein
MSWGQAHIFKAKEKDEDMLIFKNFLTKKKKMCVNNQTNKSIRSNRISENEQKILVSNHKIKIKYG